MLLRPIPGYVRKTDCADIGINHVKGRPACKATHRNIAALQQTYNRADHAALCYLHLPSYFC